MTTPAPLEGPLAKHALHSYIQTVYYKPVQYRVALPVAATAADRQRKDLAAPSYRPSTPVGFFRGRPRTVGLSKPVPQNPDHNPPSALLAKPHTYPAIASAAKASTRDTAGGLTPA